MGTAAAAAIADASTNFQEKWPNAATCWAEQFKGQAAHWNECGEMWAKATNHHHYHCDAESNQGQAWLLHPKKMVWILSRLRAGGMLSSKVVASVFVSLLPRLIAVAMDHQKKLDWKLKWKMADLRPTIEDLCEIISRTPGLEHCCEKLAVVASGNGDVSASEALLMVCTALHTLPFEAQVAFVQAFYSSQEERLHTCLDKVDEWMPYWATVPLEHRRITCDGCGMHPLRGPRFKCLTCPDYDLCGECFANQSTVHGGENAGHQFQCIITDSSVWHHFRAAKAMKGFWGKGKGKSEGKCKYGQGEESKGWCKGDMKGKGKGKYGQGEEPKGWCKGDMKGKGKGKCKGFWGKGWCGEDPQVATISQAAEESQEFRPCATPGCAFQATWHATLCCKACNGAGYCRHGPKCERKPMPEKEDAPAPLRACATPGCAFQATWHATLCCKACNADGNYRHGPKCERKPMPGAHKPAANSEDNQLEAETHRVPNTHLAFPVVVEDGRQLTIEWDSNDDPHEAAESFAVSHGILPEELPTIVAFIEHANATRAVTQ